MYLKMNEEKLKDIEKITMTDYEREGMFLPMEMVESIIDDLLVELGVLQEKLNDLEKELEENYKLVNVNPYDEYGVSEKDFL